MSDLTLRWEAVHEEWEDADGHRYYGGFYFRDVDTGKIWGHVEEGSGEYAEAHVFDAEGHCVDSDEIPFKRKNPQFWPDEPFDAFKVETHARIWVYDTLRRDVLDGWPDVVTPEDYNAGPGERWHMGLPHDPRSEALFDSIQHFDFEFNNDYFCWKSGGDGDNGESLMYLLDMHFHDEDHND